MKYNLHTSPFSFCNLDFIDRQQLMSFVFLNSKRKLRLKNHFSSQYTIYQTFKVFSRKNIPHVIFSFAELRNILKLYYVGELHNTQAILIFHFP